MGIARGGAGGLMARISCHVRANRSAYLYGAGVAAMGGYIASISGLFLPHAAAFVLLLLTARDLKQPPPARYVLAGLALAAFYLFGQSHQVGFANLSPFILPLPLLYAYLLPHPLAPLAAGLILIHLFAFKPLVASELELVAHNLGHPMGVIISAGACAIVFALMRRLAAERDKFKQMSVTDPLTGLANLAHTLETGQAMLDRGANVTCLLIDLDRFKQVNDTYGHLVGNRVLVQVAALLRRAMVDFPSVVGRLGGDEFIILVENYTPDQVQGFSRALGQSLTRELFIADPELDAVKFSFSIGEAYSRPRAPARIEELVYSADMNMYLNKYENHSLAIEFGFGQEVLPPRSRELLTILAEKDMYTYVHSKYTAQFAASLAQSLCLSRVMIEAVYQAGWLHDMGKILTSSIILRKSERVTEEEYALVKHHVQDGLVVLGILDLPPLVLNAIRHHHERWDGQGYPGGLKGSSTPLEGRILQIADAFAAMTVKRVYRERLTFIDALVEIKRCSGSQFDPQLASAFVDLYSRHIIGAGGSRWGKEYRSPRPPGEELSR